MARFDTQELDDWEQDVAALTGSFVHEVKNPLSTLNINAQLLLEEWAHPQSPREERTVRRLGVIRAEVQRIEVIVNSFLRFTERRGLEKVQCDLNDVLADLVRHNTEGLDRKGIHPRFQPDPELPVIAADQRLLTQALLNLIRNAEQAMPTGGDLIVQTHAFGGEVQVEVVDTGGGITPENLPRVFRPYFSSKSDGNGLGLPTTLKIVRAHGGTMWVESEVGKGSRFVIRLPRGDAIRP
ncbi:MAG: PAS domain-containing sensor histidine kinase [Planctomycetota bacterium]